MYTANENNKRNLHIVEADKNISMACNTLCKLRNYLI